MSDRLVWLNAMRLVIAHRLSTMRDAYQIVVIEDDHVAERVRFDGLMAPRGEFQHLARQRMP